MIDRYYNFFKAGLRRFLKQEWHIKLDEAETKIQKLEKKIPRGRLRVLIGPSFAVYPPSYVVDRALSYALRLRGVEIIPIYCDSIQQAECNFFGGDWGGKENFPKNCKRCRKTSERLWQQNPDKVLPLSRFLSGEDMEQISLSVRDLSFDEALQFEQSGIKFGVMAKDILVNNFLVATPTLIDDHENLLMVHLRNLLMVSLAYERILDQQKPDRVIANDSYYGMWAILERHCKQRGIPFYSHWPVTNNRIAFAHDDAAMNLDFSSSWSEFSKVPLTNADENRIEKWLSGERGLVINTTKLTGLEHDEPELDNINPQKPALVLAANVIWDLAALNKQVLFKDMIEWITETVEWFREHAEFQLILRPHPAETAPGIPKTRETVASAIKLNKVHLPANVFQLRSDAKVTFNELVSRFNVRGVAVHTTTVGFECPARGIPAITTAKSPYRGFGFTIDPKSRAEYFSSLSYLLSGEPIEVSEQDQNLARQFIKFYQFHYYADTGLFAGNPPQIADDFIEILSNDNGPFGHVINSIMEGSAINSDGAWMPES